MWQPARPDAAVDGLGPLAATTPFAVRLSPGDTFPLQIISDRLADLLALRDPFRFLQFLEALGLGVIDPEGIELLRRHRLDGSISNIYTQSRPNLYVVRQGRVETANRHPRVAFLVVLAGIITTCSSYEEPTVAAWRLPISLASVTSLGS